MLTVLYLKTTKQVVGTVAPPQSVATELQNLTQSELGGTSEDYGTAEIAGLPLDHVVTIDAPGHATVALAPSLRAKRRLSESDLGLVRVLEDLIQTLVDKGAITLNDLPAASRRKLNDRAAWRQEL